MTSKNKRGRKPIGDKPLTDVQKKERQREVTKQRGVDRVLLTADEIVLVDGMINTTYKTRRAVIEGLVSVAIERGLSL